MSHQLLVIMNSVFETVYDAVDNIWTFHNDYHLCRTYVLVIY